eukprot:GCRY01004966.1.p1 GENE.GCRY01004966.1~~GCRY01004966.1.p1  ORF type:complete len:622 (-),score=37.80 GCRY01004966.1:148-2013(-)
MNGDFNDGFENSASHIRVTRSMLEHAPFEDIAQNQRTSVENNVTSVHLGRIGFLPSNSSPNTKKRKRIECIENASSYNMIGTMNRVERLPFHLKGKHHFLQHSFQKICCTEPLLSKVIAQKVLDFRSRSEVEELEKQTSGIGTLNGEEEEIDQLDPMDTSNEVAVQRPPLFKGMIFKLMRPLRRPMDMPLADSIRAHGGVIEADGDDEECLSDTLHVFSDITKPYGQREMEHLEHLGLQTVSKEFIINSVQFGHTLNYKNYILSTKPLKHTCFLLIGDEFSRRNHEMQAYIQSLGGRVVSSDNLEKDVTHVLVSSGLDFSSHPVIQQFRRKNVPILRESYISDCASRRYRIELPFHPEYLVNETNYGELKNQGHKLTLAMQQNLTCVACHEHYALDPEDKQHFFLECSSCGLAYHAGCAGVNLEYLNSVLATNWQCTSCKICEMCKGAGEEKKLLLCERCDRGFHTYCHIPEVKRVPQGAWICSDCVFCLSCGAKKPGTSPKARWRENYTLCEGCFSQFRQKCYCPVCKKTYHDDDVDPMVQCDVCSFWVHIACDGISEADYEAMGDTDEAYVCPNCREPESEVGSESGEVSDTGTDQEHSSSGSEDSEGNDLEVEFEEED